MSVWSAGYVTDLEKLDLSAVRLCFQVFLMDNNKRFSIVVPPAVSDPIIDKSPYCVTMFNNHIAILQL